MRRPSPSARRFKFGVLPATVLATGLGWCAQSALATNYTWNNTTSNWNTAANWDNGVPVSSLDTTLQFGSGTYTSTDDIGAANSAFTLNGITLGGTTGTPTIAGTGGRTLNFVNNSGGASPFINVTGAGANNTFSGFTNFTVGSGVTLNLTGTANGTANFGSIITGGGGILVAPSGSASPVFALTTANTFSGGFTLNGGRLAATASSTGAVGAVTSGSLGTGTFTWNGGYLRTSQSAARTISNATTIGGNIGLGDNTTSYASAASTLTLNGATTLASTLSTYTFTVSASAANVAPVEFAGAIGEITAGTGITVAAAGTAGGTVTFSGTAANTYTGTTTVGGTSASVASVLLLNKSANVNAVGGNVAVNSFGTVRLGASEQIPDTASVTLAGTGTFDLNGRSETVGSLVSGSATSVVTSSNAATASVLTLNNTTVGTQITYAGLIQNGAGVVALVKNGVDTLILNNGGNNYSGGTTLNSGAVAIGNAAALGTGTITLNGGAFRGTNSFVGTVPNAVSIGGDVTLGQFTPATGVVTLSGTTTLLGGGVNRTLSIGGNTANATPVIFGGAIVDGGNGNGVNVALSATLGNAGILTFNGNNTYTGPTNVNSGTLLVNGNSAAATGAVTVATGATLGGAGTVGGATRVNGMLSVGAATATPALLTFSNGGVGALTLAGTTAMDVTGAGGAANRGLTYDAVTLTGAGMLTYGGTLTVNLNGTTPTVGTAYDLFDFGGETGTFSAINVTNSGGAFGSSFDYATGVLTLTAVPEPSTWTVGLLALGVLGYCVRRRAAGAPGAA